MINNLVVIGNGFDLAHGLKTSYNHFLEYLVNTHCEDRGRCCDLFNLPKSITSYENLKSEIFADGLSGQLEEDKYYWMRYDFHYDTNPYRGEDSLVFKNPLISALFVSFSLNNWCDIEAKYFELLTTQDEESVYYNRPQLLNKHFEILKRYLEEYLGIEEQKAKALESYRSFFRKINNSNTLIVNFNYTHIIEDLYNAETSKCKLIHIHGEIDNVDNPIIFGYASLHEEARELLNKMKHEYMRNIKKHLYKRTDNEYKLTQYLEDHNTIHVSILGHSCGISDNLILNQILNHDKIDEKNRSIWVSFYKDYEHYREILVNIDRIMNNNDRFRKLVVDYMNSDRMPQWDDKQDDGFENIIKIQSTYNQRLEQAEYNLGIF